MNYLPYRLSWWSVAVVRLDIYWSMSLHRIHIVQGLEAEISHLVRDNPIAVSHIPDALQYLATSENIYADIPEVGGNWGEERQV